MEEIEFLILDELYFIKTLDELLAEINIEEPKLIANLQRLIDKGWIRLAVKIDGEEIEEKFEIEKNPRKYRYVATKQGLLTHNGK